jgi:chromosome segregation ATPase
MLLLQKKPQQTEIDKKVSLEARLDESVNQKIVQFNSFKKVMADRKDLVEQDFASFCLEIETKRSKLENEVNNLEDRRKEALKPLDNERNAIIEVKNDNLRAISELDDKILVLNNKITNLKLLEAKIKEDRNDLEADKKTFSQTKKRIDQEVNNHLEEKRLFEIERQEFDSKVYFTGKELQTAKDKCEEKEKALNILISENKKRSADLDNREKLLESKQTTLKQAFEEYDKTRRK